MTDRPADLHLLCVAAELLEAARTPALAHGIIANLNQDDRENLLTAFVYVIGELHLRLPHALDNVLPELAHDYSEAFMDANPDTDNKPPPPRRPGVRTLPRATQRS